MAKRISKKRMEEIRADVGDYIARLERGEIPAEVKPAGIAFRQMDGDRLDGEEIRGAIVDDDVQPSLQPSDEKGDRDRDVKN